MTPDRNRRAASQQTLRYDASGNQRVLRMPAGARTTYSWTFENQLALIENSDATRITYTWAPVTRAADEFRAKTQSGATTRRHFWTGTISSGRRTMWR